MFEIRNLRYKDILYIERMNIRKGITTSITGIAVESIPKPIPEIITVAGPVLPLSLSFWVGR